MTEPGGVLDRDQARKVLDLWAGGRIQYGEGLLDALAACVRPAAIDRDALVAAIKTFPWAMSAEDAADRLITLALVRPVAGVWITPEEAALAAYGLRHVGDGTAWRKPEHLALAARLAAS